MQACMGIRRQSHSVCVRIDVQRHDGEHYLSFAVEEAGLLRAVAASQKTKTFTRDISKKESKV